MRLLSMGSSYAQQQAASSLSELALLPDNRDEIANAGGIPPLTRLLGCMTKGTAELAARAVSPGYMSCRILLRTHRMILLVLLRVQ